MKKLFDCLSAVRRLAMKKISVIVPAYNAHDTLARCLGSLVNQTLHDIEIIVINDASSDDTWEIMTRCKAQFPDKVITINEKTNRGSGGARNAGLAVATGEYIGFVDSDDYIASQMYEKLYNEAVKSSADIVDCGIYTEAIDKATIYIGDNASGKLDDSKRKMLIFGGGYLVTKIFKRDLFYNPPIKMREKIRCLEDNDILKYMFLRADSVSNVKEVLYNYCNNSCSQTKDMELRTYFESVYGAMQGTYDICSKLDNYKRVFDVIEYFYILWYSYGINRCIYENISALGVTKENIGAYFEAIDSNRIEMLSRIADLKSKVVSEQCYENNYVKKYISDIDVMIMKECDMRYFSNRK